MNTPATAEANTAFGALALRAMPVVFVLLWATGFIGAKLGLPDCEPMTLLTLRYAAVLVLMGGIALATRAPWPATPAQWVHIGVSGLLIHAVYLGGVFTAIRLGLPAGVTALVVGLQPVLTALGAGLLLRGRVRAAAIPRQARSAPAAARRPAP